MHVLDIVGIYGILKEQEEQFVFAIGPVLLEASYFMYLGKTFVDNTNFLIYIDSDSQGFAKIG